MLLLLLAAAAPPQLRAQVYGTDAHTVTVQVLPITVIGLSGGLVQLDVTAAQAEAGQDVMIVTDESTRLLWGTNSSGRKVTAASSLAAPRFTLLLRAVAPTRGLAAPEFPLDAVPRDLLLNVGRSSGSCALRYTGVARASQGTGTDTHVITFTIQSQ